MKTLLFFLILTSITLSTQVNAQSPLYFNIVSHNESSDPLDYAGSQADYDAIRPLIQEVFDTIIAKQAKYNVQVDANFIYGVLNWDAGYVNPFDILQWTNNTPYIDVDGHNHFIPNIGPGYNPYNYSDLAHLLDSCGVNLSKKILGGVTYADTTVGPVVMQEDWTQYAVPKAGYFFPNFLWQAEIVWGTASPGHVADYTKFGIWKPQGGTTPTEFGTHDPSGTITHIGGGCKEDVGFILDQTGQLVHSTQEIIDNIIQTVDYIQSLPVGANDFYTMNMIFNFRDMPEIPGFADSISVIIDGIKPYVLQGKIVWATLAEKYNMWYAAHTDPNDYFKFDCAAVTMAIDENENALNEINCYPNPTNGMLTITSSNKESRSVKLYNFLGQCVLTDNFSDEKKYDLSFLQKGVYFLNVDYGKAVKIVIN